METLLQQVRNGRIWNYSGGIHPEEFKSISNTTEIIDAGVPDILVIPVAQHIGNSGDLLIKVGDKVKKGQALTAANRQELLPVHASSSGEITAIEPRPSSHPSAIEELSVEITTDKLDEWGTKHPVADYESNTPQALISVLQHAGIAGMGGAGFPTHSKLTFAKEVEFLIINGVECEPYITSDDRLMREYAEELVKGIEILSYIVKPKLTLLAIEDNKPQAIELLQKFNSTNFRVTSVPTKYPSGGEKQLIEVLTGKQVPQGGYPTSVGVVMQNVGTAFAVKRAIIDGEPLISRVVTVTGHAVENQGNAMTRLGTPVQYLLDLFKLHRGGDQKLVMGGPMMGFNLPHSNIPIVKTSNCIIAPTHKEMPPPGREMPCIRCGECAAACPAGLLPQQLLWYAQAKDNDKIKEYNLFDCIECGACAYVCPSEIPLVEYYRIAKADIREQQQEAHKADIARQRHEARQERLERDKAKREAKHKAAADKRRGQLKKNADGEDPVAAALARVKAKQNSADMTNSKEALLPDNADAIKARAQRKEQARKRKAEKQQNSTMSAEVLDEKAGAKSSVAAAIARAKAKKLAQAGSSDEVAQSEAKTDSKSAVAAAIARAKAKKSAQAKSSDADEITEADDKTDKKSAVATAIARAKAKKSAQAKSSDADEITEADDKADKKSAVAAAIARAKAKKAAQAKSSDADEITEADDKADKTSAVAAAIARAKAKKAAQAKSSDADEITEADDKKSAVAAAIARAKAKKAAQAKSSDADEITEADDKTDKKSAVAAAIARAKAKKAAQAKSSDADEITEADDKKSAVAAAIARAKAKKAAQAKSSDADEITEADDKTDKKSAVAAAIARAKAKKAAQAKSSDADEITGADDKADKKSAVAAAIARAKAKKAAQAKSSDADEIAGSDDKADKKSAVTAAIARAKAKKAAQAKSSDADEITGAHDKADKKSAVAAAIAKATARKQVNKGE